MYDDGFYDYPPYIPVAERRAKAEKKIKLLRKTKPDIKPVIIAGSALAVTWWGKAWNLNLTKYADFKNRIARGRSYVRHRGVLDLKINSGKVSALVMGSKPAPYKVTIMIKPLKPLTWEKIVKLCEGKLTSLQKLLDGKFPKNLKDIFSM